MKKWAVFLDKDGTIIENVDYNVDPKHIRWAPGAEEGLQHLSAAGYRLIVITNQSGVARGYFPEPALDQVEECLREMMAAIGVSLDGFYYCPHHPDGEIPEYAFACACRKPEPGLIERAARDHEIDLHGSWFVGDILNDIEAGRRAGCKTILVDSGGETEWVLSPGRLPHHITRNLDEAARVIVALSTQPLSMEAAGS